MAYLKSSTRDKRLVTAKMVDMTEIKWDAKDTERLLTRVDAEAEE